MDEPGRRGRLRLEVGPRIGQLLHGSGAGFLLLQQRVSYGRLHPHRRRVPPSTRGQSLVTQSILRAYRYESVCEIQFAHSAASDSSITRSRISRRSSSSSMRRDHSPADHAVVRESAHVLIPAPVPPAPATGQIDGQTDIDFPADLPARYIYIYCSSILNRSLSHRQFS